MNAAQTAPLAKDIAAKMISLGSHVIFFPRGQKATNESDWQNAATRDLAVVEERTKSNPYLNVGVVGKPDGNWFFDDDQGLLAEYESQHGKILTYRARSVSGGTHLHFRQNDASREMGNRHGEDANGKEIWSARVSNRYVVAPGSSAHPDNDPAKPETFYTAIENIPVVEAPASFIAFLKGRAGLSTNKQPATESESEVCEGGRNNYLTSRGGVLRRGGATREEIETSLLRINAETCKPPLSDDEVKTICASVSNYKIGKDESVTVRGVLAGSKPTQATSAPSPIDESRIDRGELMHRPKFPNWILKGTSVYDGLIKPTLEVSTKLPEFIFMPACTAILNYLSGLITVGGIKQTLTVYLGVIANKGTFKSASAELAFKYLNYMGLSDTASSKNAESKQLIFEAGSMEGLGLEMQRTNCRSAILYYDELRTAVSKMSIEGSSFSSRLLTTYEAGNFSNSVKSKRESFSHPAGSYCVSWVWCTTYKSFPDAWARIAGGNTDLVDRMFFLLGPESKSEVSKATMFQDPNMVEGSVRTRQLIQAAIERGTLEYEDAEEARAHYDQLNNLDPVTDDGGSDSMEQSASRLLGLAQRFALFFAVDMGLDSITMDCVERAVALVKYRYQAIRYLRPIDADTALGRLQQRMIQVLQNHNGQLKVRDWHRLLSYDRYDTSMWWHAENGLVKRGRLRFDPSTSLGKGGRPSTIVTLLKDPD